MLYVRFRSLSSFLRKLEGAAFEHPQEGGSPFASITCGELPGALWGCPPLEGVASNEVQPAQAQPSPRLAKSLLKKSNACYTIVVFS